MRRAVQPDHPGDGIKGHDLLHPTPCGKGAGRTDFRFPQGETGEEGPQRIVDFLEQSRTLRRAGPWLCLWRLFARLNA